MSLEGHSPTCGHILHELIDLEGSLYINGPFKNTKQQNTYPCIFILVSPVEKKVPHDIFLLLIIFQESRTSGVPKVPRGLRRPLLHILGCTVLLSAQESASAAWNNALCLY